MLMRYHWPGNVRELENCAERAVLLCTDHVVHSYHLPPTVQTAEASNTVPSGSLSSALASFERDLIVDALKMNRGNMAAAVRLLDTSERVMGLISQPFVITAQKTIICRLLGLRMGFLRLKRLV
jgi:Nif-specific regulatory protein